MIELPDWAIPNGAEAGLIDFGSFITPALGGEVQRIDRMGNRHRISITFPPMPSDKKGRILVSRLKRAKTEGLRIEYPLLDFKPGAPGSPLVKGAGQSGTSLILDGFTPYYAIREGQWFSIETNGRHYLYSVNDEVIADASGNATISINPMLRAEPNDNDVCHFAKPMIEGFAQGNEFAWTMALERNIGLAIDIEERA